MLLLKGHRTVSSAHSPQGRADEATRLRGCIEDLTSILTRSETWTDRESSPVIRTLLRTIVGKLGLDFAYLGVGDAAAHPAEETLQLGESQERYASDQDFVAAARACLASSPFDSNDTSQQRIGGEIVSMLRLSLGSPGRTGHLVVGCRRTDFPSDLERLVLHVVGATHQAVDMAVANETLRNELAERQKAERTLRARERQARLILENIPAFVIVLTSTGEIEEANTQTLRYLGRTLPEIKGWATTNIVHPDDLAHTVEVFSRSIASGSAYDLESRLRSSEGDYRWFRASGIPLAAEDGRVERWYVVLFDIDDRKRAEEHLRESERQLRRREAFISEGERLSKTGTFYWNTRTGEIWYSDELKRVHGYEPDTPPSLESMLARVHPEDREMMLRKIDAGLNDRGGLEYEVRFKMPDGQIKWVSTIARRYQNEDGALAYVGAVRDVTERHNAEEALSKLRSELAHLARVSSLGVLAASIAHEVNQPLAGIVTNASTGLRMLAADPPNVAGALETVRRTMRDANRASDVVARLRSMFSRKETVSESVDLNEAAQEVIALSLSELQRSQLSIQTQLAGDLPHVCGDRVQLQQVILNLILNAADATKGVVDRAREILVKTQPQHDGAARLTVVDSGMGIDPQHAEKLFEPFYTTKSAGMGIGLSISRSIVEQHGGRLWAESNDGHGASFSFSIPARKDYCGSAADTLV